MEPDRIYQKFLEQTFMFMVIKISKSWQKGQ